jgi:hypothetical protein
MNDDREKMWNEYVRQKEQLDHLEADSYKSLDKTLLVLSSGAISLSMTFIDRLPISDFTFLLMFSWMFWLLSIFSQLISLYLTPKAMREEGKKLNEQFELLFMNDYMMHTSKLPPRSLNKYRGWPTRLSNIAMVLFGLGSLSFMTFVVVNIISK